MDILESLEVRWYLPSTSEAGAALTSWFATADEEGGRVDHYLATGRHDVSFKARIVEKQPAKVETKYLSGSLGIVRLAPSMTGALQRWTKLSLELDDPKLRQDGVWLAVKKTRRLRKYAVTLGAEPSAAAIPIAQRPPIGCGLELTRLEYSVDGVQREELTCGLEAFGPATRLLDVLQATCRAVAGEAALPDLPVEWTASYASWLLSRLR